VTVDGRSFLPGDPGQDDFAPVRQEFEKFGVEVPKEFGVPAGDRPEHAAFRSRFVGGVGPPSGGIPALPHGLIAEHTLRLESPTGSVDLVLGKMHGRGPLIRNRLIADGWEGPGQEEAAGLPWLLEKRIGKGKSIVCLDEAEGTFLLFREAGR
jgi:hypothetical protein